MKSLVRLATAALLLATAVSVHAAPLDGARQLIVVTSEGWDSTQGQLQAYVRDGSVRTIPLDVLTLQHGKKYLINVGSVGQPRDGDWRAAYCIYDTNTNEVKLRRLEYDLPAAQDAIVAAGLPRKLAERLAVGR